MRIRRSRVPRKRRRAVGRGAKKLTAILASDAAVKGLKDGSLTAGAMSSKPPTYPAHLLPDATAKL